MRYTRDTPQVETRRRADRQGQRAQERTRPKRPGERLSDAKRLERERRRKKAQMQLAVRTLAILIIVVATTWSAQQLYKAPIYKIDVIRVEGARHLDTQAVVAQVRTLMGPDDTLVRVSKRKIQRQLELQPWIDTVKVDRDFPHTLRVVVTERAGAAFVDATPATGMKTGAKKRKANIWIVSSDGVWLENSATYEKDLPVINDVPSLQPKAGAMVDGRSAPALVNALAIIEQAPKLTSLLSYISAPSAYDTVLMTKDRVEILFGEAQQVAAKQEKVLALLDQHGERLLQINVRVPEDTTVRYINGQ